MKIRQRLAKSVPLLDKYLIFDTQGGSQDVIALIAALKLAQKYDQIVLGITCVAGRRNLDSCIRDALIAQQIAHTQVPVFRGSSKTLMLKTTFSKCVDQSQNFSKLDAYPLNENSNKLIKSQPASLFIAESIKNYKSQLSIITLGPLTNVALAFHISMANKQHHQVSSIRINGGSYTGVGNVIGHSNSEGNFFHDPEAAHIILKNYQNIYINPIERTLETNLKNEIQTILANKDKSNQTLSALQFLEITDIALCGPLLNVLPVFSKSVSPQAIEVYSEVMKTGNVTAGMMVNNWLRLQVPEGEQKPNTKIFTSICRPLLLKLMQDVFG